MSKVTVILILFDKYSMKLNAIWIKSYFYIDWSKMDIKFFTKDCENSLLQYYSY